MEKPASLELYAGLAIERNLVSWCAVVHLAGTCFAADVPGVSNSSAVLTLLERGATTAVAQVLVSISALIFRRLVGSGGSGDGAGSQLGRAALDDAVMTLGLPATVVIAIAPVISSVIATIIATIVAAIVTTIVTSIAATRRSLRRSGVAGGRSRALLAAPGALGPGITTLAGRLGRVLMTRSAAALLGVPVPVVLGAVTRAGRSRGLGRSSVVEAAAESGEPKLVALAAVPSFNGGFCGREANKSCGEDDDASERFHLAAERMDTEV